jgi:hypothetical protein
MFPGRRFSILAVAASLLISLYPAISPNAFAAACTPSSTYQSGFVYFAFKDSGAACTWTLPSDISTVDYLLVGGGGSGGSRHAGGGGAGGMLTASGIALTGITSLNITVGSGGASVVPWSNNYAQGLTGNNSTIAKNSGSGVFATVTAYGGGGGESGGVGVQSGGSGGGSQSATTSTPVTGQGNRGGTGGTNNSVWWAGGGGGSGNVGLNGSSSSGGTGGPGSIWTSAFTTTVATALGLNQTNQISGNQVYFAGGGGGSISNSSSAGDGGLGGGGAGIAGNNTATSGTANSGGGGGGSGCCNGGNSGAGGSGVAIFRYPANAGLSISTSGTISYRVVSAITATANIDGRVSFFANGRIIPGCRNLMTSSKTVACSWKPSLHGAITVTASIASSAYAGYTGSSRISVNTNKRTTSR